MAHQPQHAVIRTVAKIISYLFHPLFVPVLIAWFLIRVQPPVDAREHQGTNFKSLMALVRERIEAGLA